MSSKRNTANRAIKKFTDIARKERMAAIDARTFELRGIIEGIQMAQFVMTMPQINETNVLIDRAQDEAIKLATEYMELESSK